MIERKFVAQKIKEFQIEEFVNQNLSNVGHSHTKMLKTPLGEKIVIYASRPGLVIGRKGQNIRQLTKTLKKKFNLENPQIEISEIENINLDAQVMAERIVDSLERFGTQKFKGIGHRVMSDVMGAGALGIEILISGKVPSSRAKSWRFYSGYLKKCGDIALVGVNKAYATAQLKTGVIGIKLSIMPPDIKLPDDIHLIEEKEEVIEEVKEGSETTKEGKLKKGEEKETKEAEEKETEGKETKKEVKGEEKKE
ncbi:30S ribosomal protein S3 [Candidatus Woesearchaeota archaeon]|nr:30S ribosomal protein S3 [Candidatus Woesearchaeota archaeon]